MHDKEYVSRTSAEYKAAEHQLLSFVAQAQAAKTVVATVMTIDPPMAQVLLDRNEHNRNFRPGKLAQYKSDMKDGRFVLNGESIIIDVKGQLANGQHRSLAILETGVSIQSVFSFGVAEEAKRTMDIGAARKGSEALGFHKAPNAANLSAMLKLVVAYERAKKEGTAKPGFISLGSSTRVTIPEIEDRYLASLNTDHDLLTDAASYAASNSKKFRGLLNPQHVAFSYWLLAQIDRAATVDMLDKIGTQANLTVGSPIFTAYNKLKAAHKESEKTKAKNANERLEILFTGWNMVRKGQSKKKFVLNGTIPQPI